jgi:hypothetical protein
MRGQPVKRVVDASETQGRFILHLECGHYVSVGSLQVLTDSELSDRLAAATEWPCAACPDPPPTVREKTPQQLWKEAGEP